MGHFHKLAGGERISEKKLTVSAPYKDEFGTHTWDWFEVEFTAGGGGGGGKNAAGKYTESPLEEVTKGTKPSAREVVNMLVSVWPELTQTGARTLTSQFMAETGGGMYCFNWNLGNVKAGANEPHMYLKGVWEVSGSREAADGAAAKAGGKAHVATEEEIKKHGWGCPPGKAIVVFDPPHAQCRFRAYANLQEGAQRWLNDHRAIVTRDSNYLNTLNSGDTAAVAKALKKVGYYSAAESNYARGMGNWKKIIDKELGGLHGAPAAGDSNRFQRKGLDIACAWMPEPPRCAIATRAGHGNWTSPAARNPPPHSPVHQPMRPTRPAPASAIRSPSVHRPAAPRT
jgi:hypothetical protein